MFLQFAYLLIICYVTQHRWKEATGCKWPHLNPWGDNTQSFLFFSIAVGLRYTERRLNWTLLCWLCHLTMSYTNKVYCVHWECSAGWWSWSYVKLKVMDLQVFTHWRSFFLNNSLAFFMQPKYSHTDDLTCFGEYNASTLGASATDRRLLV